MGKLNEIQEEVKQSFGSNSFTTTIKQNTVEFDSKADSFTFADPVNIEGDLTISNGGSISAGEISAESLLINGEPVTPGAGGGGFDFDNDSAMLISKLADGETNTYEEDTSGCIVALDPTSNGNSIGGYNCAFFGHMQGATLNGYKTLALSTDGTMTTVSGGMNALIGTQYNNTFNPDSQLSAIIMSSGVTMNASNCTSIGCDDLTFPSSVSNTTAIGCQGGSFGVSITESNTVYVPDVIMRYQGTYYKLSQIIQALKTASIL